MTLKIVPLASLIEDLSMYPRHAIDSTWVGQLAEAHLSGAKLPPPVVDRESMRIVDGWHRVRMYRRVLGENAEIEVDLRAFKSHAEIVRFAVDANMTHGRKLDRMDRVRCAMLLAEAGLPKDQVAVVLRIREPQLQKLVLRVAPAPAGSPGVVPGTTSLPLKRSAAHMTGVRLTARQAEAHASLPGTSLSLLARQLTTALRNGFVDRNNERLMAALEELNATLTGFLADEVVPAK